MDISAMMILNIVLLFVVIVTVSSDKQFIINDHGSGFDVTVGGVKIFQHSIQSPMLFIGQGKTVFAEGLGNFFIKNIIQERVALIQYNVTGSGPQSLVQFSRGVYKVEVTFQTTDSHSLVVSMENLGQSYGYTWLRTVAEQDEYVFGGGEQYSHFNLREKSYSGLPALSLLKAVDQTYPIWTREQGVGRNVSNIITFFADAQTGGGGSFHTTYFPQPTIISSRKYYLHYDSSNYMVLDFSVPMFHEIFVKGDVGRFLIKTDTTILKLVQGLSAYLGRMPALPDWAISGITLGIQGGTDVMLQRLKTVQDKGIQVNALWIQDWSGDIRTSFGKRVFWNWKLNTTLYHSWNQTIAELTKQGIRVMVYVNPNLNSQGDLFKEGDTKGFLLKNAVSGKTQLTNFGEFYCGIVDFTNPDAFNWYKNTILKTNMIGIGLGGWMADFGEYLPADGSVKFFNNETGDMVHNKWPVYWARMNREALEETNQLGNIVFFMRAGFTGTSNYTTLLWAGDQDVDFGYADGIPSTVPAALSSGVCGIGFTHFDIGGYTTFASKGLRRTTEVLIRSAEVAVFTPYMRSHEGNQPTANVQVYSNDGVMAQFVRFTKMHSMLANYTRFVMKDYTDNGTPAQRPLFFEDESDTYAMGLKFQYMYGPDLIIAPIIQTNVTNRQVYLPTGTWIHIWTNKSFDGKMNATVGSKLGETPVFFRKGSQFTSIFQEIGKMKAIPLPVPVSPPPVTQGTGVAGTNLSLVISLLFFVLIRLF